MYTDRNMNETRALVSQRKAMFVSFFARSDYEVDYHHDSIITKQKLSAEQYASARELLEIK